MSLATAMQTTGTRDLQNLQTAVQKSEEARTLK